MFIQRGPVAYLVATAFDYADPRLYALHRITRPRLIATPRNVPAGFEVEKYLQSGALGFGGGDPLVLRAHVSAELAYYLAETPLATDQQLKARGEGYELKATVVDSWQLRFWILSQGSSLRVLSPAPLRRSIESELEAALAAYRSGG